MNKLKLLSLTIMTILSQQAFSETNETPETLPEMKIIADKPDVNQSVKNTVEKINYETIMQETNPGMKQPIINGLMGDQISLSLDGIKFSNSLFRSGPNQYYSWIPDEFTTTASLNSPINAIANGSLGGNIDRTLGVDKSQVGISSNLRGYTAYAKYKDSDWHAAILNTDNDNVATPRGVIQNSAYNQKGAMVKHTNKDYGDTTLVFTRNDNVDRTDKFAVNDYYMYDLQQYIMANHKLWLNNHSIYVVPSFQQFREKIDRAKTSNNIDSTDNIYGLQVGSYFNTKYGTLDYGVNESFEDISLVTGTNSTPYKYNTLTGYGVWDGAITDSDLYKIKYSYSWMTADGSGLDTSLGNNVYGVDFRHIWSDDNYSYASFDSSAKFPTINNLSAARQDSLTEIANPDLKQEHAFTYTIGHQFYGLDASLFYKDISDVIIRTQTDVKDGKGGFKWKYNNANTGYIEGAKLAYNRKFDSTGTNVYAMGEYITGRNDYDYWSKFTPFHAEVKLSQDIGMLLDDRFIVQWRYAPSVPNDRVALNDKTDVRTKNHNYGYNILNLGYEVDFDKHNKASLTLFNTLNNTGRIYGSSVDFNERTLMVRYNYYF